MVWPDKAIFMTWKQSSYERIRQILFSKVWGEWKWPQSKIEFKNDNNFSEKETRKCVFSKLKHRQKSNTISKRTLKMYKNWLILWLRPTSIINDFDTTYFLLNYTSSSRAWRTIDIRKHCTSNKIVKLTYITWHNPNPGCNQHLHLMNNLLLLGYACVTLFSDQTLTECIRLAYDIFMIHDRRLRCCCFCCSWYILICFLGIDWSKLLPPNLPVRG